MECRVSGDLDWSKWAVHVYIFARDVSLYSPVFEIVRWNPARRSYSNATLNSTSE